MFEWRYILDTSARPIRFVPSILAVPLPPPSSHNPLSVITLSPLPRLVRAFEFGVSASSVFLFARLPAVFHRVRRPSTWVIAAVEKVHGCNAKVSRLNEIDEGQGRARDRTGFARFLEIAFTRNN